jgi:hypothetical protein
MEREDFYLILMYIGFILFFGALFYFAYKEYKQKKEEKNKLIKKIKEKKEKENLEKQNRLKEEINLKINKVDILQNQLYEIQKISVPEISELKNQIIQNEKQILEKGSDQQLFLFMKIDSFLRDFNQRISEDIEGVDEIINIEWLKTKIVSEGNRKDLDKLIENLEDTSAILNGKKTKGFDANIDTLFKLGNTMQPAIENQIKTMNFYKNMAIAMIIFYLNDKKIMYFEIYNAFEKLGIFDSTWQKNVLNKLENIEIRLTQINNQLTELNQNFIGLIKSSENILNELNNINSNIISNNLLQAITAYQTWKINDNIKS